MLNTFGVSAIFISPHGRFPNRNLLRNRYIIAKVAPGLGSPSTTTD
jgi:hypothetical protein